MAIYTRIPAIIPIKVVPYNTAITSARYHSPLFDKASFKNWIHSGQRDVSYTQKIQRDQIVCIQFHAIATLIEAAIVDCHGTVLQALTSTTYQQPGNTYNGSQLTTYQWSFKFSDYPTITDGTYYIYWAISGVGAEVAYRISEPLEVADEHPSTVLIEFSHDKNDFDVIFLAPLNPQLKLRVEGAVNKIQPVSVDTSYRNASYNPVMLSSIPSRKWNFGIGYGEIKGERETAYSEGVPEYMVDKVNRILGCRSVAIDSKKYVRDDNAQWETSDISTYPLVQASISLLEGDSVANFEETTTAIVVFTIPDAYPFAVESMQFLSNGGGSPFFTGLMPRIIEDLTDLGTWITALNSGIAAATNGAVSGTFSILSGDVIYTKATGEPWFFVSTSILTQYISLTLEYNPTPPFPSPVNFKFSYYGSGGVLDDGNGNVGYSLGINFPITIAYSNGTFNLRLFINSISSFSFNGAGIPVALTGFNLLGGTFNLQALYLINHSISSFDLDNLLPAKFSLQDLQLTSSQGTVTGNMFSAQYLTLLYYVRIKGSLSATDVDTFFNNMDADPMLNTTNPNREVDLSGQSTAAPPTSTSLTARNNLINQGWSVITD